MIHFYGILVFLLQVPLITFVCMFVLLAELQGTQHQTLCLSRGKSLLEGSLERSEELEEKLDLPQSASACVGSNSQTSSAPFNIGAFSPAEGSSSYLMWHIETWTSTWVKKSVGKVTAGLAAWNWAQGWSSASLTDLAARATSACHQNSRYPIDIPVLPYVLDTFIHKEVRQLSEYTRQGKMLSCSFYCLSQYLGCSSIAFLLYWKILSL